MLAMSSGDLPRHGYSPRVKVVVAGGTGALGRRLCEDLAAQGHDVVVLTRRARPGPFRQVEWDGETVGSWSGELEGSVVVNLAGELVDRRPTPANIELLTRSRVEPTRALVAASAGLAAPVRAWLQMSTLAIYGDAGDEVLDESAPPAEGPPQMAGVAKAWEAAVDGANTERLVILRTGIVLDRDTPALNRLFSITRWGLGGPVGPGTQWVSWIHVEDWLALVRLLLAPGTAGISGIVHATGPQPVRNARLMDALRRALHRPLALPTPTPLIRLGAVVLRTDPALALTGRRCVPRRLLKAGFEFRHPDIDEALAHLSTRDD